LILIYRSYQYILTKYSELLSETSSSVLSKPGEKSGDITKLIAGLKDLSIAVPSDLARQSAEISEIRTLVSDLAESTAKEIHNISIGINELQRRFDGNSSSEDSSTYCIIMDQC
jgi:hypothetical protein